MYLNRQLEDNLDTDFREDYEVAVVIPAYNEENAISRQIDNVKMVMDKTGLSYVLIVVDDGSTE